MSIANTTSKKIKRTCIAVLISAGAGFLTSPFWLQKELQTDLSFTAEGSGTYYVQMAIKNPPSAAQEHSLYGKSVTAGGKADVSIPLKLKKNDRILLFVTATHPKPPTRSMN